ncbi:hypothetical protein J4219_08005 [Candidatus Woesearchaeota archaeon]|nr:hypothetical protein [Candidatus Woesearchaeota archaeon]
MPKTINTTLETIIAAGLIAAMAGIYCNLAYKSEKMTQEPIQEYSPAAPVTSNYQ